MTTKDFRPFNLEHAKAGAPVGRMDGKPIRIICYDSKCYEGSIVALVTIGDVSSHNSEEICCLYTSAGFQPSRTSGTELVMLPLGYVDDKPVFVGDKLERLWKKGDAKNWRPFTTRAMWSPALQCCEYRWPKKKVIMEVWQPRYSIPPFIGGTYRDSKEAVERDCGRSFNFVEAIKTGEYEVEE